MYINEPKIDGLSFRATYRNGILVEGATRGDGYVGEHITENLKNVRYFPLTFRADIIPNEIEIWGEVYMLRSVLNELNIQLMDRNEKPLSNTRNAAAGSLRQLNPEITKQRKLDYFVWGWGYISPEYKRYIPETRLKFKRRICSWGFKCVPTITAYGWETYNDTTPYTFPHYPCEPWGGKQYG